MEKKQNNKFILCLAEEEATLHKLKDYSVSYKINQIVLNSLSQIPHLPVKQSFYDIICASSSASTNQGIKTLLESLKDDGEIFDLQKNSQQVLIEQFYSEMMDAFDTLIAGLTYDLQEEKCFALLLPELVDYQIKTKGASDLLSFKERLPSKAKWPALFNKLMNPKELKKKCDDFIMKKSAEDKKKMQKPQVESPKAGQ